MADKKTVKLTYSDLRGSFSAFVLYIWLEVFHLPKPTRIQKDICAFLDKTKCLFKMVWAFRGVGKSFLTAAYVAWRLWRDPNLKVLVVSATGDKARNFATQVMGIIETAEFLSELRPTAKTKRWSTEAFDVVPSGLDQSPSVKSVGITGQITGTRADLLVFDDIEIPNNSATPSAREKIMQAVDELMTLVLKPGGEVVILGTPQTQDTVYNKIKSTKQIDLRVWPVAVPNSLDAYKGSLAPVIELDYHQGRRGDPTDSERFPVTEIEKRRAGMTAAMWSLQMMLDTELTDAEKYPLKLRDLIVTSLPSGDQPSGPSTIGWSTMRDKAATIDSVGFPKDGWFYPAMCSDQWMPFDSSVMAIDPAGRGKDELAYCVVKSLHGILYVTKANGLFGGPTEDNLKTLVNEAKVERVNKIIVEENFGGGAFSALLKPLLRETYPCTIEDVRSNKQKEARILDTLEPVVANHRLVVVQDVIERDLHVIGDRDRGLDYSLWYQFTRITRDRGSLLHDDRLDALAMAVAYLMQALSLNPHEAAERHESALEKKWLDGLRCYPKRRRSRRGLDCFRRQKDNRMGSFGNL